MVVPGGTSFSAVNNWTAGAVRNSLTRLDRLEKLSRLILYALDKSPEELFDPCGEGIHGQRQPRKPTVTEGLERRIAAVESNMHNLESFKTLADRSAAVEARTADIEEKLRVSSALLTELMRYNSSDVRHKISGRVEQLAGVGPLPPLDGEGLKSRGTDQEQGQQQPPPRKSSGNRSRNRSKSSGNRSQESTESSPPAPLATPLPGGLGGGGSFPPHFADGVWSMGHDVVTEDRPFLEGALRPTQPEDFAGDQQLHDLMARVAELASSVSTSIASADCTRNVQSEMAEQLTGMETRLLQVEGKKEFPPELLGVIAQLPQVLATTATAQQQLMDVTRHHTGELAALQTRIPDDASIERLLGTIETVVFRVKANEGAIAENKAAVAAIRTELASFPPPAKLRMCEVATASIHLMSAELGEFRRALHQLRQRPPPT